MIVKDDNHKADIEIILSNHTDHFQKKGIIHIGAHQGEEVEYYLQMGFENILLIEANPEWVELLNEKCGNTKSIKIFGVAVSDTEGTMDFHINKSRSGNTEPSSLLKMKEFNRIVKTLQTAETIPVAVTRLDSLFEEYNIPFSNYNFINIDIQGAELMAFKGAHKILSGYIDAIISEVNLIEMYEDCPLEKDIVNFLGQYNFKKVNAIYHTLFDENGTFPAWGECLFIKS